MRRLLTQLRETGAAQEEHAVGSDRGEGRAGVRTYCVRRRLPRRVTEIKPGRASDQQAERTGGESAGVGLRRSERRGSVSTERSGTGTGSRSEQSARRTERRKSEPAKAWPPGAVTKAASAPCGADWSGICRSGAPPEPAEAVQSAGRFRGRERSVPLSPVHPKGLRRASAGDEGAEVEATSRRRTAASSAQVRNEPKMNPRSI